MDIHNVESGFYNACKKPAGVHDHFGIRAEQHSDSVKIIVYNFSARDGFNGMQKYII